jgi:predicted O-linked N-acetylglucosamine transferase (SPINDLY family)
MGADYIDYIIADNFVIPAGSEQWYTEKVVRLPDSFQANDHRRERPGTPPLRAGAGLPEAGFVFCSFNGQYKITPTVFDVWMRLLGRVPGSVLWLAVLNATARDNLRREAASRGVQPHRLVFAPELAYNEHLARLQLADLFLDTLPYNAGATASDALWAGVPIVTCTGDSFASRMAGSLLRVAGMPQLVTGNLEDYQTLALQLARAPALLAETRKRLAQFRLESPLFNTERFCRHLEKAYISMWERHQSGEPAASISVQPMA